MMILESFSESDTFEIGKKLAMNSKAGDIFALSGDLGVGKTVFAKGFAEGLGIKENISSPTFTFVLVYENGRMPLYHFDMYRIADPEELEEIGYEDYFFGEGVCLVEWPSRVEELLPENTVRVSIEKDLSKDFMYRKIVVEGLK